MQIWCFSVKWKGTRNAVKGYFRQSRVKFFSLADHGWQHLRSLLGLFSLGKFMNHFWKVKSNPVNIQ